MAKSKIIRDFASGQTPLPTALMQLKLLLKDLNQPDLLKWVNSEISGYSKVDDIPDYRKTPGILTGTIIRNNYELSGIQIALKETAPDALKKLCSQMLFYKGVNELQELMKDAAAGEIKKPIKAEYYPMIRKYAATAMSDLLDAYVMASASTLAGILAETGNKVLDIFSLLEDEMGVQIDDLGFDLNSFDQKKVVNIEEQIVLIIDRHIDNSIAVGDNNIIKNSKLSTRIKKWQGKKCF